MTIKPRPPFRAAEPTSPLRGYNQPLGFLPTIKKQFEQLQQDVFGIKARLGTRLGHGEPAAAIGQRVFQPEAQSFDFDVLQLGEGDVPVQYVLRNGQTYNIPIIFPPPGVFRARYLTVALSQRVFVTALPSLTMQYPTVSHGVAVVITSLSQLQTNKFSYPTTATPDAPFDGVASRMNFCWNLIDNKSGNRLSDEWLPDTLLLPAAAQSLPYTESRDFPLSSSASGGCFEFDLPWLFERDADITFQFRPLIPILQPTVATGAVWPSGDDREFDGGVRNNALTVKVELHGTRHYTEQDAKRAGALSRDD